LLRLFAPLLKPLGQIVQALDRTDHREGHARPVGAWLGGGAGALRRGRSGRENRARHNQGRCADKDANRFHTLTTFLKLVGAFSVP
jgi:hypothetical protein